MSKLETITVENTNDAIKVFEQIAAKHMESCDLVASYGHWLINGEIKVILRAQDETLSTKDSGEIKGSGREGSMVATASKRENFK